MTPGYAFDLNKVEGNALDGLDQHLNLSLLHFISLEKKLTCAAVYA